MAWTTEKSTKYKNEFAKENYDQLRIVVKKGKKEKIKDYAESKGLSLNAYVNKLIDNDMGETDYNNATEQDD